MFLNLVSTDNNALQTSEFLIRETKPVEALEI